MKKKVKDWLVSAEGDLLLIEEIATIENLTHLSAFHAQQANEKSFKAIVEEFELGFIKTHSLETLFNQVRHIFPSRIELDSLILLVQLYIDSRYPGEMGLLPDGKPTVAESTGFFNLARTIRKEAESICRDNNEKR
ncbi:MAG: HEPN domain-containing protein [Bacteroidia bacterium]|nr:HEPN domain-containing protein [Bacteroidia bacterium]